MIFSDYSTQPVYLSDLCLLIHHCITPFQKRKSTEVSYFRMRGNCFIKLGELSKAIKDYKEVVKMVPESQDDHLILSELFFNAGKFREAVNGKNKCLF